MAPSSKGPDLMDELNDLLGLGPTSSGVGSNRSDNLDFDFDPNPRPAAQPRHRAAAPSSPLPAVGGAAPWDEPAGVAPSPAAPWDTPPPPPCRKEEEASKAAAPVDPDVLKRRIYGGETSKPSMIGRARDGVVGCLGLLIRPCTKAPRWVLMLGALVLLALAAGGAWYGAIKKVIELPDFAIKMPIFSKDEKGDDGKVFGLEDGDQSDSPDTAAPAAAKKTSSSSGAAVQANAAAAGASGSADIAQALAALRETVADSNRGVRDELEALKREVSRLRGQIKAQSQPDRVADGDVDAQASSQDRSSSPKVGRIRSEVKTGRPAATPAPAVEEDDPVVIDSGPLADARPASGSVGRVGEVQVQATPQKPRDKSSKAAGYSRASPQGSSRSNRREREKPSDAVGDVLP
eukprot:gnl/TRDRNA2_/TRDRNA2_37026_c0_seq1.p1 gnl/TRDRNA2_/TRDRNA2_37026_c0~~gnl/TRDRNA2_/TRDRNA2_37026_c0_seq1.p1  ORF type:complete len:405 (-),score=76.45 gnl/TRDRNA2_/TRDRNA2_37026_c0_seq1:90-1304(-)